MIRKNILPNIILIVSLLLLLDLNCSASLKKKEPIKQPSKKVHNVKIDVKVVNPNPTQKKKKKVNPFSHLFIVLTEKCSPEKCVSSKGKCLNENVCKCKKGYANSPEFSRNKNKFCQYKQKKQIFALLLEIFFFFGAGHLYSHRIIMFFVKFLLFATTLILRSIYNSFQNEKKSAMKIMSTLAHYGFLTFYIFYHLIDLMMFYLNKYTDGFGVPLSNF